MKAKNLIGVEFGRLTVLERQGSNRLRHALWLCKCECGNYKVISSQDLLTGKTKSCGCLRKEISKTSNETHKMTKTKIYTVWRNMKKRCYCKTSENYKYYGGRGITVCEEWRNSFETFYNWAVLSGYDITAPKGKCTLDRIDVNGNYEPSNCRWVSIAEQNRNKRKKR